MSYPKVYTSIQPVSEPEGLFRSKVKLNTDQSLTYEGEGTAFESQGTDLSITNEKLANYKMVIGTDRSLYGLLKKNKEIFPNGPYHMDSRDDGITIHNHNFNQPPKYVYTYAGGNGELISCNISTHKQTKSVQAEQSSTIDPLTKEVSTSVSQVCVNEEPKDQMFQKKLWASLNKTNYSEDEEKQAIIKSAKDERSTKEELQSTYQVTQDDIKKYVDELKTQFRELYDNAKSTGDILPLLRANTMKKGVVKVKRKVRTLVNPMQYSQDKGDWASTSGFTQMQHNYNQGVKYLKSSSNIIFLGYNNGATGLKDSISDTGTSFPYAEVIMEKEIELELDGYRILSSPLAKDIQNQLTLNGLSDSTQKVVKCDLKVVGRPGLVSSLIIYLNNLSSRYTGEWYTKKVKHSLNTSGYICTAELIPKSSKVIISNTTSRIDTRDIYKELNKVASDRMKSVVPNKEELSQAFLDFVNSNSDLQDKSLVLDLNKTKEDGQYNIYPASEDQVNITREREKYRQ